MSRLKVTVASTRPVPRAPPELTGFRVWVALGFPVTEIVAGGRGEPRCALTVTPPESCPEGPPVWPHQLFSTLAPTGAETPMPGAKSLWLTIRLASPLRPPAWILAQVMVTAAPLVLTAGPPSLV